MRSVENRLSVLGGATVAASGLLWLVPAINSIAAIAGIVALILIVARLGYSRAFSAAFIGFILAAGTGSLTIGYPEGFYYGIFYAIIVVAPGMAMGWASRSLTSPVSVVSYGLIPFGILYLLSIYTYMGWMMDLSGFFEILNSNMEILLRSDTVLMKLVQDNYGASGNAVETFLKEFDRFIEGILRITPGFLFAIMLGTVVFSLVIAGFIATRMGVIISRFGPFHLWKASGWWLLPTVLGLIPVVFRMEELWFYAGINILIVTGHVYMVVGLAIMEAFFKRIILPLPIRIIFYVILILAGPISMTFLAILGLSDTKFNFKREIEDFENKE